MSERRYVIVFFTDGTNLKLDFQTQSDESWQRADMLTKYRKKISS